MSRILTVSVGRPREAAWAGIGRTSIDKTAVRGPVRVGRLGLDGDEVSDTVHHGGPDQAVYAFAREELDRWERELGRELPHGMFGENLTTADLDVDAAEVGDRWRVGTALLEVRGPRVPCATFAERLGERGWVKRFAAHGRSGVYLQVNQPGQIRPGDSITVTPSGSALDVPTLLRAFLGDPDAAPAPLDSGALAEHRAAELAATAGRG